MTDIKNCIHNFDEDLKICLYCGYKDKIEPQQDYKTPDFTYMIMTYDDKTLGEYK